MKKIAIHSVPRSGSSWLGEIINSSPEVSYAFQPLFSYTYKSYLNTESNLNDINNFFSEISNSNDEFLTQKEDRDAGLKPSFIKHEELTSVAYKEVRYHHIIENLLETDSEIKVIGLIRNPYFVMNSWYGAPREFRKDLGWNLIDELMDANLKNQNREEEFFGLNKWIEVTLIFNRLKEIYPDRFYIVDYQSLCDDSTSEVKSIYKFIGIEYTEQTDSFLNQKESVLGTYSVMKSPSRIEGKEFMFDEGVKEAITAALKENNLNEYIIM